jgi:hypothetical protein
MLFWRICVCDSFVISAVCSCKFCAYLNSCYSMNWLKDSKPSCRTDTSSITAVNYSKVRWEFMLYFILWAAISISFLSICMGNGILVNISTMNWALMTLFFVASSMWLQCSNRMLRIFSWASVSSIKWESYCSCDYNTEIPFLIVD